MSGVGEGGPSPALQGESGFGGSRRFGWAERAKGHWQGLR